MRPRAPPPPRAPLQCGGAFVSSVIESVRATPRLDSLRAMVPCDLWTAIGNRTLWFFGDSQGQRFYRQVSPACIFNQCCSAMHANGVKRRAFRLSGSRPSTSRQVSNTCQRHTRIGAAASRQSWRRLIYNRRKPPRLFRTSP